MFTAENIGLEMSDKEIVERILSGEKELFERLIRKYNLRLYRVARSIVKTEDDVEDLMQSAYIKAYENMGKFQWRSSFSTWLIKILANECFAYLKKKKRFIVKPLDDDIKSLKSMSRNLPTSVVLNNELRIALENALLSIHEKYRTVFMMREIEEMSIAETAQALELTESNVKIRLSRAKMMLQKKLNDYYKNDLIFSFHLSRCDKIVKSVFSALALV